MTWNLFSIAGLFLSSTCFLLVVLLAIYGKTKLHRIWTLFNISVGIWGLGAFLVGQATDKSSALLRWQIAHVGIIFIPVFVFHLACILCEIRKKYLIIFAYAQGLIFIIFDFTDHIFISGVRYVFSSFYYLTPGIIYPVFLAIWVFLVLYAHYELFLAYRKSKGIARNQILYLFFGTAVGFVGGITNFLPVFRIDVYPIGNFTIPLYCLIVTYAIIRYQLMDIRIFISYAAAFLLAYPFLLGIPFFFAYRMYPVLFPMLGNKWWLIHTCLMAFFATLSPLAYNQLKRRMEDVFVSDQKRYQKLLLQAASGMVRERNINHLAKLIVYIIKKVVRIKFAAVFLDDDEHQVYRLKAIRDTNREDSEIKFFYTHPLIKYLRTIEKPILYEELPQNIRNYLRPPLKFEVIVPSFVENNLLGFIFLGEKLNGHPYTNDDLVVFKALSHQAALAINYCSFLEDFKNAQERVFTAEKQGLIGGMADGAAHQIKNRLNEFSMAAGEIDANINDIIKKYPELMQEHPDVKKILEDSLKVTDSILSNVTHTDGIIKGILNYGALSQDEKAKLFGEFSLKEMVKNVAELVKTKHQIAILPLTIDIPTNDNVYGVQIQIHDSIFNIIDNAYEACYEKRAYHLKGEEKLTYKSIIDLKLIQNDNHYLIIVTDNGIGIKDEDRSKIFSPFFTTKSSYVSGTGIGMYIVKRLIEENHHGKIWFDSAYMEGTTFYVKLPKRGAKL